ncbi:DUF3833 family protein [Acidisphaera rubrifaciens]|uniref:Lipoprotein n=1 Tax=Acidisphaera rubrifaciens HS-AP3 TaxID=1231350 RepID=A0A0D6P9V4_9PROT|nr:DUF3833 family protein [Acidisphaera rubrifaciens]GAN77634.1 hypothetical protein Asru_0404_03 [Acidisphaera rubrifaciens HS-AP3]
MPTSRRPLLSLLLLLAVAACDTPLPITSFAGTAPVLRPEQWFAGTTRSWGVFEDSDGAPVTGRFTTDATGTVQPDGSLMLAQTIHLADGTTQRRTWHLTRLDAHRYAATAGPVVGTADGEAYGRAFHWTYRLRLPPGDWLHTVRFEHWMYLSDDGTTLLNRFTVSKLGIVVARASETFVHVPGGAPPAASMPSAAH